VGPPIRLRRGPPAVRPQAIDRNLDPLVAPWSSAFSRTRARDCRLSRRYRNPFEAERRRRGRTSGPQPQLWRLEAAAILGSPPRRFAVRKNRRLARAEENRPVATGARPRATKSSTAS